MCGIGNNAPSTVKSFGGPQGEKINSLKDSQHLRHAEIHALPKTLVEV